MKPKQKAICPICQKEVPYSWHHGSYKPLFDSHVDNNNEACKQSGWHVSDYDIQIKVKSTKGQDTP